MSMLDSRQGQRFNKMCDDIHDIDRKLMHIGNQLTRIADALERAYPKISKVQLNGASIEFLDDDDKPRIVMRSEIVDAENNV